MEEFEKVEKVKFIKKMQKVGSLEFSIFTVFIVVGGIQFQILQVVNIQLNFMNVLNILIFIDVQFSFFVYLRKNFQLVRVVDDQKFGFIKIELMLVFGLFVSFGEVVMGDQIGSVKDELIDIVDFNILLFQFVFGLVLFIYLIKMV